jgi:hypothetical protein
MTSLGFEMHNFVFYINFLDLLFIYNYAKGVKIGTVYKSTQYPGADPGFQVRGGALKKNCVERREARKFLGYFV